MNNSEGGRKARDKLLASDPDYYSNLAKKRKVKSGGSDPEIARRAAQERWRLYRLRKLKEQEEQAG